MGQVLGKVTTALDGERGPDAIHRIVVPPDWLAGGVTIDVELPRYLSCANCEGGGCDTCQRSGALTVRERDESPEVVTVTLPRGSDAADLVLRIPDAGGYPPPEKSYGRGLLLLRISQGASLSTPPSQGVRRASHEERPLTLSPKERRLLIQRSVVVAVGLTALFVLLLWLSGWL